MFNKAIRFAEKKCFLICVTIWALAVITSLILILAGR